MSIIISTDRLIPSSEARKRIGQLIDDIQKDEDNYYVILENGKVAALLVHPNKLKDQEFPSLEKIRKEWSKNTKLVAEALDEIDKIDPKKLPSLLK